VGDDRAALGLAGVAVQAGVKSALASLWFIQDASTVKLVNHFYERLLNSDISKAEALREAQLELIEAGGQYNHPAYWAPFILIGNWL
jgi:CHAT domain-containing protein